ncbi:hypothetical protein ACFL2L_00545 [Patescibacteria group bacterium]
MTKVKIFKIVSSCFFGASVLLILILDTRGVCFAKSSICVGIGMFGLMGMMLFEGLKDLVVGIIIYYKRRKL